MHCKTNSLARVITCGLPTWQYGKWFFFFARLVLSISWSYCRSVFRPLLPSEYWLRHKNFMHCYQSFELVNLWVCMIIFTKIILLLHDYLTSLKKKKKKKKCCLAFDITDTVCLAQGLVKSETTFQKSICAAALICRRWWSKTLCF